MVLEYPKEVRELLKKQQAVAVKVEGAASGKPACPNCSDLGVVYIFRPSGGPFHYPPMGEPGRGAKYLEEGPSGGKPGWYTGHLEAMACPACNSSRLADWLADQCGLKGLEQAISIDAFHPVAGKEQARQAAVDLLAQNRQVAGFLTYWGGYGTGKTMLLQCLVNGLRKVGNLSVYSTLADLLGTIRDHFGDSVNSIEDVIDFYNQVQVLCIDEVEKPNLTRWAQETIQRLIDARYRQKERILTVLATNLAPWQLPTELGYLASRMTGGQVAEVGGVDMRPVMGDRWEPEERKDLE